MKDLQSLYWQSEELKDCRWKIQNQIGSLMKRGKKPRKHMVQLKQLTAEINTIWNEIRAVERGNHPRYA